MMAEFFPVSILTIGTGIPTAFGGLGLSITQFLLTSASEMNFNPFMMAGTFYFLIFVFVLPMPETYEMEPRD